MKRYLGIIVLLLITCYANAQDILKGTVVEADTHEKLSNVFVHNTNNKQITLVDKNGRFEIRAATGHTLIFDSPGYLSDTLFLADMRPIRVELKQVGIVLKEVNINSRAATFNPRTEYPEVYTKSKVYVFSPSTWFSKEGKDARRLKRFFAIEERERYVDKYYTASYVGSLVPLKGIELQNFMALYRPSYAYVKNNTGPSLAVYINDSYQKYKALPPEKRKLPGLNGQ
ncbi:carboxypeptidase-like regulatory domain-containing protein [Mucilaginibacter sp. UR6-11]|uniref:carboxypeptidase-like regulatory domain-containing protein n=1 Tax=Mucilaginibacter sp. UR6-11 TaxID=1435644 RepID=UPI001E2F8A89|nr:carboxypeptidase-like regulatory domain-containing protein [Mucilaginibacter sp. UR6-11]MCC8425767.1 carboxypeptidase-like regulatory domain-containing protein [Mucilaginibacter sp. UR6-11]